MPESTVRVLLVESNAASAHLMRLALREVGLAIELTSAGGLATALARLEGQDFDVVLLNPALPDAPEGEAVGRLRQAAPEVPLLLLAAAADVRLCLRAMEQGAHDYLFKDVLTTHLLARTLRDALDRHRAAPPECGDLIDPLTGLANCHGLLAQAARLWVSPARLRKGATLLYLAVEGLAALTSSTDRALVETADVLRETFRGSDLRARVGEGEFVVLAVGAPEPTAAVLTARLDETLQAHNAQEGRRYHLALSAGLAHYHPERPTTVEELLDTARARLGGETLGRRDAPAACAL
jgi:diguanylate cyclase (GGDEF)-like protein